MGRKSKRRSRESSGSESDKVNKGKVFEPRGPSGDTTISVSDILSATNAVLYGTECVQSPDIDNVLSGYVNSSVSSSVQPEIPTMAEPLNSELLAYLKKIATRIDNIEKGLNPLEEVERKVSSFE
ncbi:hypothetical protein DPMN_009134 [Dreissena polymorpha]|uniref:Uncharacterized protein n=1 Tax=Dreissena polymorpha TaxID=45954 RepID=A0A9D4N0M0_DREPO|nr:hypothetical protein DPMN_009134 [Dreissena polymorpha]